MTTSAVIIANFLLVVVLAYVADRFFARRRPGRLPPGPRGWPIIGNIPDMPTSYEWKTFAKWGEKWGDIVYVNLLGQPTVILNSFDVAVQMLEKKGSIYSDRPTLPVCGEVIGWDRVMAMLRYGPKWREMRRLLNQSLIGPRLSLVHVSHHLEHEIRGFLMQLSSHPGTLTKQVRRFSAGSILKVVYGYTVEQEDDKLVHIVDKAVAEFSVSSVPGAFLADMLPILKNIPAWLPGAGWKRTALAWRQDLDAMCDIPYNHTKQQMEAGMAVPSFVAMNLKGDIDSERESLIKDVASSLYGAGADTIVSALRSFFLAMMCFPEVQKKAQAEIDRVIGDERLPKLADRDHLPYVEALCCEVLRWQPITPLGFAHRSTEDDVHDGYLIPKGTMIITNVWKMLRDPVRYTDPETFNPDRFTPLQGREPECDPRLMVFGFGRRLCPGSKFAQASLFLIVATSLAVFDIAKPVTNGTVVEPSMEYTTGSISHPHEFECSIKPRSAKAESLILALQESGH